MNISLEYFLRFTIKIGIRLTFSNLEIENIDKTIKKVTKASIARIGRIEEACEDSIFLQRDIEINI